MKSQDQPILSDIDEDNFDRAFGHFRGSTYTFLLVHAVISLQHSWWHTDYAFSVIQGVADVTTPAAKVLTEEELATTLEFCAQAYMPPNPEDKMFQSKIQLVGVMASSETIDAVAANELHGKCMRLERGNLGLNKVTSWIIVMRGMVGHGKWSNFCTTNIAYKLILVCNTDSMNNIWTDIWLYSRQNSLQRMTDGSRRKTHSTTMGAALHIYLEILISASGYVDGWTVTETEFWVFYNVDKNTPVI